MGEIYSTIGYMFYSHSGWFSVNSLPAVHKYLQAAWVPAGWAVQIGILNTLAALAWEQLGLWGLWGKALKTSASEYLN